MGDRGRSSAIDRVLVPKAAPAFSALGVLVADYVVDLLRSYVQPLSQVDLGHLQKLLDELAAEARASWTRPGWPRTTCRCRLFVQMCYPGRTST